MKRAATYNKKISILGMGYVGLPMAIKFAEVGHEVIGYDPNKAKVKQLSKGKSFISHIHDNKIKDLKRQNFKASSNTSSLKASDVFIICVPTPLDAFKQPDMSFIADAVETIKPMLQKGQLVCLVSTTYPGTTEEFIIEAIKEKDLIPGKDVFVIYSPEREDPGNKFFDFTSTPRVIGGYSKECLQAGKELFSQVVNTLIQVSSLKTAEMVKLLENIYRSVNIGLVNEIKKITDKMDIDIFEVIDAAASKPFGYTPFYPGPGLGGHCIPIDPYYLSYKSKELDLNNHFIELAGEINTEMPYWVVGKVIEILNQLKKSVNKSKILILGIAYKKDINDLRESPSLKIIKELMKLGATISYSDSYIPKLKIGDKNFNSRKLTPSTLLKQDLVLIITDHTYFDFNFIKKHSKVIIDTRGVYKKLSKGIFRA